MFGTDSQPASYHERSCVPGWYLRGVGCALTMLACACGGQERVQPKEPAPAARAEVADAGSTVPLAKTAAEPDASASLAFLESEAASCASAVDATENELRVFRETHAGDDISVAARQERLGQSLSMLRNARENAQSKSKKHTLDAAIKEAQEEALLVAPLVIEEASLQRRIDVLRQQLELLNERVRSASGNER